MTNEFVFDTHHAKDNALRKDTPLTNEFDVVKFIGTVHSPIKSDNIISSDLKLATFKPKEKEYIIEQVKDATIIRRLFNGYGQTNANKIYSFLTTQVQLMGILGVNDTKNFLVKSFLKTNEEDDESELEPDTKQKSKPRSKPTPEQTDDDDDDMM